MEPQIQGPNEKSGPPPPRYQSLEVTLKLLQEQEADRLRCSVPLAASLLRACAGNRARKRAQVIAHEALRLAKASSGNNARQRSAPAASPAVEVEHSEGPLRGGETGRGVPGRNGNHKGSLSFADLDFGGVHGTEENGAGSRIGAAIQGASLEGKLSGDTADQRARPNSDWRREKLLASAFKATM